MKINGLAPEPETATRHIELLNHLLAQPDHHQLRPCPGCSSPCPCSGSPQCTCHCETHCEHAPRQLSSDSERYPVENKILPLVFMLQSLRVFPTYWSCEGHVSSDQQLRRLPQVWFYSRNLLYPKLISELLSRLASSRQIHYPWRISLTYSGEALDAGFSLEPFIFPGTPCDLEKMQNDARVIAENLVPGLRAIAREHLTKLHAMVS